MWGGAHILGHKEDCWDCRPVSQPTRISSVILILCRAKTGIMVLLVGLSMPATC